MKRLLYVFSLLMLITVTGIAQTISATTYPFTNSTGATLEDMSSGTTQLVGANLDDGVSTVQNIGFDFWFVGVRQTQFSVNGNGLMRLGNTVVGSTWTNDLATATNVPQIAAYWDDLYTGTNGQVHYKVTGTAPNRKLVVEWQNIQIPRVGAGNTGSGTFQCWLYETSGVIEFVYGSGIALNSANSGYSIGFGSSSSLFASVTSAGPSVAYGTANNAQTNAITSGTKYTFTPPIPIAPGWQTPTSVTGTSMQLNWTDNSSDEVGFAVYRSTDGTNYTYIATAAANATSYLAAGLNFSTLYYWQIYAVTEGALSSAASGSQSTNTATLSGTKYVGTGTNPKDYDNLTLAFTDISNNGLAGNLTLIIQSGYPDVAETYPIAGPAAGTTGTYTVTIYPDGSGYTITSANPTGTLDLNGSKNIILDGRVNGTGTAKDLVVENTNTAGFAIRFINDASNDTIRYCVVKGVNTSSTSGVILFSTTTGTTGNDNNLIDNCDIRDGATTPVNCVYSAGTTTTAAQNNSSNTISNSNIFNFFSNSTTVANGISLGSGNTDWTITGNSFYQTVSRAFTAAGGFIGITISNTSGNNFTVSGNYVGGSAPSAGSTAWTQTGAFTHSFIGIRFSVGTTTASNAQGNVIKNLSISTSSTSTIHAGIAVTTGLVNVGNVTGNTIGDMSSTGNITYSTTGTAGAFSGLLFGSGTPVQYNIQNNNVGGITVTTSASGTVTFRGIWLQGTPGGTITPTISNNTIGGNIANSISNSTNLPTHGIHFSSTSTLWSPTVSNNIVRNLTASSTGTAVLSYGIYFQTGGAHTVTGNTVSNISCASTNSTVQLIGIMLSNTSSSGNTLSQNTIHTLKQTNSGTGTAHHAIGIYFNSGSTTANIISKNFIHSLSLATTGSALTTQIRGIDLVVGATTVVNNMIRLGLDESGNSVVGNYFIQGINKATSANCNIYFNSVYIGGTVTATGSVTTAAFRRATTGTDDVRNNIFVNARSKGAGTDKHYALTVNATTTLTCNYNLFNVTGTGGVFGNDGTADRASLAAWQTATGFDASSGFGDPNYVAPTGTSATVDLHVQSPTPIEGAGILIGSVTDDFDGQTRSGLTPVDIGADADNFTAADIFAPTITYTTLPNTGLITNRTLASVTISDASGVPTSGALQPRIWYRRSGPVVTGWATNQGTLMSGTGTSGTWDFVIDYTFLAIVPAVGDVFEYYVVAQDIAGTPNISTNPAGGVHVDVNIQTTPPTTPRSYSIVQSFAGLITVGTPGGMFNDLTSNSPTGLFASINAGVVAGPITVQVISNLAEPGTNGLNQWIEEGGSGFTMTIQPAATPTAFTISGAFTGGLIRLNGADRVTIDGRVGGVGPGGFLFFRSTDLINSTIVLQNDASNNTIRNCIIEGANNSATQGVVFLTPGAVNVTGNDNNLILENTVKDRSDVVGVPVNLIYSAGWSTTVLNSNNTISNNELYNFTGTGIFLASSNSANENFTITGNYIFQFPPTPRTTALYGMQLNTLGDNNLISQNTISDLATSSTAYGIYVDNIAKAVISRNRIYNFPSTSGSTSILIGIYVFGNSGASRARIINNQISLIPGFTNAQSVYGIRSYADFGDTTWVYYNSVYVGGTGSGSSKTYAFEDNSTSTGEIVINNSFVNARTGGTGGHFAARHAGTSSITDMNSNYNFFSGNGPTPANFFELSSTATSFTGFKAAFTGSGKDANSWAVDGSGLIATNLYNNVSTGDLNINTGNTEAWYVNGKGTQISGLTDDFGALGVRSDQVVNGSTDIGADEFVPSSLPITATASGAPAPSTTTTYSFAGRQLGSITWGAGGTVPSAVNFVYYSGTWPAIFAGNFSNAYYDITVPDGSGYSYDITLNYDPAIIGTIPSEGLMRMAKYDGTWVPYTGSTVNTTTKEVTLTGLSSFSLFTFYDDNNPVPIEINTFTAKSSGRNIVLNWQTTTEVNSALFEIQRSKENTSEWTSIGKVNAAGNSNSPLNYSFTDNKLSSGKFNYRLKMIDADGRYSFSSVVESEVELPKEYAISQNYPNPFNPSTRIDYQLPFDSKVTLELYGITGEKVATVINTELSAGYYTADINAGALNLASGMYIYRIVAVGANNQNFTQVKKLMLTK